MESAVKRRPAHPVAKPYNKDEREVDALAEIVKGSCVALKPSVVDTYKRAGISALYIERLTKPATVARIVVNERRNWNSVELKRTGERESQWAAAEDLQPFQGPEENDRG